MIDRTKIQDAAHNVAIANKLSPEHMAAFKRMTSQVLEKIEPQISATIESEVAAKVKAERERLCSIAGADEASGHEALALELATSGLEVDHALKILRETPPPANGLNQLSAAMQGYRPNVNADCADWEDLSEEEHLAQEILNA